MGRNIMESYKLQTKPLIDAINNISSIDEHASGKDIYNKLQSLNFLYSPTDKDDLPSSQRLYFLTYHTPALHWETRDPSTSNRWSDKFWIFHTALRGAYQIQIRNPEKGKRYVAWMDGTKDLTGYSKIGFWFSVVNLYNISNGNGRFFNSGLKFVLFKEKDGVNYLTTDLFVNRWRYEPGWKDSYVTPAGQEVLAAYPKDMYAQSIYVEVDIGQYNGIHHLAWFFEVPSDYYRFDSLDYYFSKMHASR